LPASPISNREVTAASTLMTISSMKGRPVDGTLVSTSGDDSPAAVPLVTLPFGVPAGSTDRVFPFSKKLPL